MNGEARIWILIPAYNAAQTLPGVVSRIPRLPEQRILVVNDGSVDGTGSVARAIQRRRCDLDLIESLDNRGYARTQKFGFDRVRMQAADVVVLLHADGQYPPEYVSRLVAPILKGAADCVLGSRMAWGVRSALSGGMPLYKCIGNRVTTGIENFVFGLRMSEYHSGFIAYSSRALSAIPYHGLGNSFHFDGEMLLMASKLGMRVGEIGIPTHYGDEVSHLRPLRYLRSVAKVILRERRGHYDRLIAERRSAD